MKIYAIDVDEADEVTLLFSENIMIISVVFSNFHYKDLRAFHFQIFSECTKCTIHQLDDALSATRLQDGRTKIWIHVADPTRFLRPGNRVDR